MVRLWTSENSPGKFSFCLENRARLPDSEPKNRAQNSPFPLAFLTTPSAKNIVSNSRYSRPANALRMLSSALRVYFVEEQTMRFPALAVLALGMATLAAAQTTSWDTWENAANWIWANWTRLIRLARRA